MCKILKKNLQELARHKVQFIKLLNKMADCSVRYYNDKNQLGAGRALYVEERFPPIKAV